MFIAYITTDMKPDTTIKIETCTTSPAELKYGR